VSVCYLEAHVPSPHVYACRSLRQDFRKELSNGRASCRHSGPWGRSQHPSACFGASRPTPGVCYRGAQRPLKGYVYCDEADAACQRS
jgi:hypothetical protein